MISEFFLIYCIGMGLMCDLPHAENGSMAITGSIQWQTTLSNTTISQAISNTSSINATPCKGQWVEIVQSGCLNEKPTNFHPSWYDRHCNTAIIKCVNASWDEMARKDRKLAVVRD